MNRFKIRTEVRFNQNALDTLYEFNGMSAVVITDKFMVSSGIINKITDKMQGYKSIAVFDEITPDPTTELIAKGLKFITENSGEIVIALGGGSAIDAVSQIKLRNPRSIRFMGIIAAPEGIKAFTEAHPDVKIYCAALDEKLNEVGYIVPGLGDAGDRIFGTK